MTTDEIPQSLQVSTGLIAYFKTDYECLLSNLYLLNIHDPLSTSCEAINTSVVKAVSVHHPVLKYPVFFAQSSPRHIRLAKQVIA